MNINSKVISEYASACGVCRILQTRSPLLKGTRADGIEVKALSADVFERVSTYFCKMTEAENAQLPQHLQNTRTGKAFVDKMPQIRELETETAAIYKPNGIEVPNSNTQNGASAQYVIAEKSLLNGSGFIHNHPTGGTLSEDDLKTFFLVNMQHVFATNPKTGYAVMSRIEPVKGGSLFEDSEFLEKFMTFFVGSRFAKTKIIKKGISEGKSNIEILREIDLFSDVQNKRFVEKHKELGLKYEYVPGELKVENLIDFTFDAREGIKAEGLVPEDKIDELILEIDNTPIEEFYY